MENKKRTAEELAVIDEIVSDITEEWAKTFEKLTGEKFDQLKQIYVVERKRLSHEESEAVKKQDEERYNRIEADWCERISLPPKNEKEARRILKEIKEAQKKTAFVIEKRKDKLYTTRQASEELGLSVHRIYQARMSMGLGQKKQIEGSTAETLFFSEDDIDAIREKKR